MSCLLGLLAQCSCEEEQRTCTGSPVTVALRPGGRGGEKREGRGGEVRGGR